MRKIIIIVPVVITSMIIAYFLFNRKVQPNEPAHLSNIPPKATWVGGSDGGSWYYINKVISEKTFQISIYNDNTGELEIKSIFNLDSNCLIKKMDSLSLLKNIVAYDGEQIILRVPDNGKKCGLIPI